MFELFKAYAQEASSSLAGVGSALEGGSHAGKRIQLMLVKMAVQSVTYLGLVIAIDSYHLRAVVLCRRVYAGLLRTFHWLTQPLLAVLYPLYAWLSKHIGPYLAPLSPKRAYRRAKRWGRLAARVAKRQAHEAWVYLLSVGSHALQRLSFWSADSHTPPPPFGNNQNRDTRQARVREYIYIHMGRGCSHVSDTWMDRLISS